MDKRTSPDELVDEALGELRSTMNLGRGRHAKGWSAAQKLRAAKLRFEAAKLILSYALPRPPAPERAAEEAGDDAEAELHRMLAVIDAEEAAELRKKAQETGGSGADAA